jgi:hypothetical protein
LIKPITQKIQELNLAAADTSILMISHQSSESFHFDFSEHCKFRKKQVITMRYNLFIECKSCRNGHHGDCSSKQVNDALVRISCTCLFCNNQAGGKNNIVKQ